MDRVEVSKEGGSHGLDESDVACMEQARQLAPRASPRNARFRTPATFCSREKGPGIMQARARAPGRGVRCAKGRAGTWHGSSARAKQALACRSTASTPPPPLLDPAEAKPSERMRRLESLIALKQLYRDSLRAYVILQEEMQTPKIEATDSKDQLSEEALENLSEAVRACDEVTSLLTKIGSDLRSLSLGKFDDIFEDGKEAEERIKDIVRQISKDLASREAAAEAALPKASLSYAKRILEERGEKRRRRAEAVRVNVVDPEKWAQRWSAVQKAQPEEVIGAVRDVWVRLNGGGRKNDGGSTPLKLPKPSLLRSKEYLDEQRALKELVVGLDNQLREKSKAREARLRKGDVVNRARLVTELRKLDTEVSSLSKQLAIYIVKVESGSVYSILEEEAIEVSESVLMRSSARSDDELAILAAELSLIEQTLAPLLLAVEREETELIPDEILETLGSDMRDLRNRLGIADEEVFPAWDLNWKQVLRSVKDSTAKVKEGTGFYTRGLRLFNADVNASIRLFWRAVLGDTLKPREVQTLRRTVRDVLSLIPFTIILIAPLTPIGHVLVFGFLQKYFPGFFPSQFSSRRQELFLRYEELRNELTLARERLMSESEESTFKEVQAAVQALGLGSEGGLSANLLRSVVSGQGDPSDPQDASRSQELPSERALRKLERRVQNLSDAVVFSLDDPDESRGD